MGKTFNFISGALFGAAAGAIIGVALAPRSGAETRAMAADIANDAWDNMRDTYEHGAEEARAAVSDFGPMVDAKTDDLRAKVDLARERMEPDVDSSARITSSAVPSRTMAAATFTGSGPAKPSPTMTHEPARSLRSRRLSTRGSPTLTTLADASHEHT